MTYLKGYDSMVCGAYIYERLHDALDTNEHSTEDIDYKISRLSSEMANNFYKDTGVKIGAALGWDKPLSKPVSNENGIKVTTTTAQRNTLYRKWKQAKTPGLSFNKFLSQINPEIQGAITIEWCGMILCIETDGHCHS